LEGVENQGALLSTRGGMRLSFSPRPGDQVLPDLHAGNEIAVLAQAKRPQVFRDDGAFDRRAYLATQNIDLVATLRASELTERVSSTRPSPTALLARFRRRLREEIDTLFSASPQVAGVLRAMLLGDRSFLDREEATDFQKTGVFHVLVVAGLHVGALAAFLFWAGWKLRLSRLLTIILSLILLLAYGAVVEQRPPVLRAALMAAMFAIGTCFYRRLDLLNSAAIAALLLMIARPLTVRDSSFSFLAIGCIAGLALPWLARTTQPYVRAVRGWRDVTRDAAHEPRAAQFRIDLRATAHWISARSPSGLARTTENALAGSLSLFFRAWELAILTVVLQIGMLPLMARNFHRITFAGPLVNLAAVPLTSALVPIGFLTLGIGMLFPALGHIAAMPLSWFTLALIHIVQWFAKFPRLSYRIPGPPLWLPALFFILAILIAVTMRISATWRRAAGTTLCAGLTGCSAIIALFPFAPKWSPGKLELTVLDVGQGDSLFVVSPRGRTLLIDGGGAFGGFRGQEEHAGVDPGAEALSRTCGREDFRNLISWL
jgi:competence protein ComEC